MELAAQPCGVAGEQGAPRDPASEVGLQWQALRTGCDRDQWSLQGDPRHTCDPGQGRGDAACKLSRSAHGRAHLTVSLQPVSGSMWLPVVSCWGALGSGRREAGLWTYSRSCSFRGVQRRGGAEQGRQGQHLGP